MLTYSLVLHASRVAGYFKLARSYAAEMFYFYYRARTNPAKAPLVIWLTGR